MVSAITCRDEVSAITLRKVYETLCLKACEGTNANVTEVLLVEGLCRSRGSVAKIER